MENKITTPNIDQKDLLDSILRRKGGTGTITALSNKDLAQIEQPKKVETPGRKRNVNDGEPFLKRKEIKSRQCVYISAEVHEIVKKIVDVVTNRGISMGDYVEMVLLKHFEENKDVLNELYHKDREDLI